MSNKTTAKTVASKAKTGKSANVGKSVSKSAGKSSAAKAKPASKPVKPAKPASKVSVKVSAKAAAKPSSKSNAKAAPAKTAKAAKAATQSVGKPAAKTLQKPSKPTKTPKTTKPDAQNTQKSNNKASMTAAKSVVPAKSAPAKTAAKPSKASAPAKPDKKTATAAKAQVQKAHETKADTKAEAKTAAKADAKPAATPPTAPAKRKGGDKPLLVSPAPDVGFRKEYVPVTSGAPTRDFTAKLPPINAALKDAWKKKPGTELTEPELLAMPDAEYMNESQLAFFKLRLQTMKDDLLKHADETTEHLREDTLTVPDPADRATIEEEHALELRTRDRERKLLKKIQQAIVMIDNGEYGFCEETGEPIGVRRLLARPTANLSLEAQQRREIKQKLYGD